MAYVNVKTTAAVTPDQRSALTTAITQALSDILGEDATQTIVVIDQVPKIDWGPDGPRVPITPLGPPLPDRPEDNWSMLNPG